MEKGLEVVRIDREALKHAVRSLHANEKEKYKSEIGPLISPVQLDFKKVGEMKRLKTKDTKIESYKESLAGNAAAQDAIDKLFDESTDVQYFEEGTKKNTMGLDENLLANDGFSEQGCLKENIAIAKVTDKDTRTVYQFDVKKDDVFGSEQHHLRRISKTFTTTKDQSEAFTQQLIDIAKAVKSVQQGKGLAYEVTSLCIECPIFNQNRDIQNLTLWTHEREKDNLIRAYLNALLDGDTFSMIRFAGEWYESEITEESINNVESQTDKNDKLIELNPGTGNAGNAENFKPSANTGVNNMRDPNKDVKKDNANENEMKYVKEIVGWVQDSIEAVDNNPAKHTAESVNRVKAGLLRLLIDLALRPRIAIDAINSSKSTKAKGFSWTGYNNKKIGHDGGKTIKIHDYFGENALSIVNNHRKKSFIRSVDSPLELIGLMPKLYLDGRCESFFTDSEKDSSHSPITRKGIMKVLPEIEITNTTMQKNTPNQSQVNLFFNDKNVIDAISGEDWKKIIDSVIESLSSDELDTISKYRYDPRARSKYKGYIDIKEILVRELPIIANYYKQIFDKISENGYLATTAERIKNTRKIDSIEIKNDIDKMIQEKNTAVLLDLCSSDKRLMVDRMLSLECFSRGGEIDAKDLDDNERLLHVVLNDSFDNNGINLCMKDYIEEQATIQLVENLKSRFDDNTYSLNDLVKIHEDPSLNVELIVDTNEDNKDTLIEQARQALVANNSPAYNAIQEEVKTAIATKIPDIFMACMDSLSQEVDYLTHSDDLPNVLLGSQDTNFLSSMVSILTTNQDSTKITVDHVDLSTVDQTKINASAQAAMKVLVSKKVGGLDSNADNAKVLDRILSADWGKSIPEVMCKNLGFNDGISDQINGCYDATSKDDLKKEMHTKLVSIFFDLLETKINGFDTYDSVKNIKLLNLSNLLSDDKTTCVDLLKFMGFDNDWSSLVDPDTNAAYSIKQVFPFDQDSFKRLVDNKKSKILQSKIVTATIEEQAELFDIWTQLKNPDLFKLSQNLEGTRGEKEKSRGNPFKIQKSALETLSFFYNPVECKAIPDTKKSKTASNKGSSRSVSPIVSPSLLCPSGKRV